MPKRTQVANEERRWSGYARLQKVCRKLGIDGPTQLATALARQDGDMTPVAELSVSGPAGWWNGTRMPRLENIEAIVRLTGVNLTWLVTGKGDMFATPPGQKDAAFDDIAKIVDEYRERAKQDATKRRGGGRGAYTELRPDQFQKDQAAPKARSSKRKGSASSRQR